MPSVSVTPLQLAATFAEVGTQPARVTGSHLRLVVRGGSVSAGPGTGTSQSTTTPELDRLTSFEQLLNPDGTPSHRFMAIWQEAMEKIEDAFAALSARDDNQDAILARLEAAYLLAETANDNAVSVGSVLALADSYVDPANVLTASNTGTITVAAHERVYGDTSATRVDVDGATITGLSAGASYRVYYADAGRTGGAVSYQATQNNVAQTGNIHVVGSITIPAAGETDTTGTAVGAPGTTDTTTGSYEDYR